MPRQINLVNPAYRKSRHPLNAFNMVLAAGAVYALFAAWNLTEQASKRGLDARKAETEQRLQQAKAKSETLTVGAKKIEPNKQLLDDIAKLELRLRVQREVLTALETGGLGSSDGFSPFLSALARQRLDGVWLTKVTLTADNQLAIGGRLTRAELLPGYIRLLNKEEALRGRRFGELKLITQSTPAAPVAAATVIEFELGAMPKAN